MGENERFRRLLEPVYAQALAFARHVSKSSSDGDDLFQEALLRALAKLDGLRDESAFKPWLFRIVISIHRNRCRRAFWKRFIQLGASSSQEDAPHISGNYRIAEWSPGAAEAARRARDALASLAPGYREAIVLFEIEGWQVEELAALMGISASAIKSRLARGRAVARILRGSTRGRSGPHGRTVMIDKLIAADFSVLAREHQRVPPLDAVMPREREKIARKKLDVRPWIAPVLVVGSGALALSNQGLARHPQSPLLVVLSMFSIVGLFGAARSASVARQLGAIVAAALVAVVATSSFAIAFARHSDVCAFSNQVGLYLGSCADKTDEGTSTAWIVVGSCLAIAAGYAIARPLAKRLGTRSLGIWPVLASIASATVVTTWLGISTFADSWINIVAFRFNQPRTDFVGGGDFSMLIPSPSGASPKTHLDIFQTDRLLAALAIAIFLVTLALAYRSENWLARAWRALWQHVTVAPVAIAVAMSNLMLYSTWERPMDGPIIGLAMFAVLVALTSTQLRRFTRASSASPPPAPHRS